MCSTSQPIEERDAVSQIQFLINTFDRRARQPHYLSSPEAQAFHEGRETGLLLALGVVRLEKERAR